MTETAMLNSMDTGARTKAVAEAAAGFGGGYVALYCRISVDKSGRVEGVRTQEKWGRAYAARAWPGLPVRVFADNQLSAANDDVVRPGYNELRAAIARGEVAHLWGVEQSRLERREAHWFTLAAELDAAGVDQLHTNRDGIVPVRSEVAGIKAVLYAAEVRRLKQRVNDTLRAKAELGQPSGSRPYGYRRGVKPDGEKTYVIVEEEAAIVRECAERVLSGWSLTSIWADLVERGVHGSFRVKVRDESGEVMTVDGRPVSEGGVPLTRPSKVTVTGVKQWVTNAAVAGLRVYRGEVLGQGNWAPILDEQTWRAVRNRLSAPRTVIRRDGSSYDVPSTQLRHTGRRYLLTGGVAVCAVCDAALSSQVHNNRQGRPVSFYSCTKAKGGRGCVSITAEAFEGYVVDTLLAALDRDEFWAAYCADEHTERRAELSAALEDIDVQRSDLAKEWTARRLTMLEWRQAREGLAAEERRLRVELASVPAPVTRLDRAALHEAWPEMNLDECREIISMFIDTVAVGKVVRHGSHAFDPRRIAPPETWWRRA